LKARLRNSIVQLCRQQASSPVPREASPGPALATNSRKQKPSPSQGLHRQVVTSQAARQQPPQAANAQLSFSTAQLNILQKPHGTVLAAANGQCSVGSGAVHEGMTGVKAAADGLNGTSSGPQRSASGRMLNPFASTFIPRTDSGNLLSTSATSSH